MQKRSFLFSLVIICVLDTQAQTSDLSALHIGDRVTSMSGIPVIHYPTKEVDLATLNKKNILLDFWSYTCAPCIAAFPKLQSLQEKFGKDLQIVLVNPYDSAHKIDRIYDQFQATEKKALSLPCLLDMRLKQLFPHTVIPHYVMIGKDGKIKAITSLENITEANIAAFVSGEKMNLPLKYEINQDRPLFASDRMPEERLEMYSVYIKGFIGGGTSFRPRMSGPVTRGWAFVNWPIIEMYQRIINQTTRDYDLSENPKRRVLEVRDSAKLLLDPPQMANDYYYANLSTYELIAPVDKADSLYALMWNELNRYSGYIGSVQTRTINCFKLVLTGDTNKLATKGGKPVHRLEAPESVGVNMNLSNVTHFLNQRPTIARYIVNETGYKGNIDIQFPEGFANLATIQKQLARYNLALVETQREMPMFVLTEK